MTVDDSCLTKYIVMSAGFWLSLFYFFFLAFADIMITYLCDFKVKLLPCLLSKGSM